MATQQEKKVTQVIMKNVRFSFPHVFKASAQKEDEKKKFSVSAIIAKDDEETKKNIDAAIAHLVQEVKDRNKGKLPVNFKLPLRDGDTDREDDEAYADSWFVNCSSGNKPGLIDKKKRPIKETEEDREEGDSSEEFYAGCYGHVSVNFYVFKQNGEKNGKDAGIAAGLNNIMKVKDGDRLAGRSSASEDFADWVEDDDDDIQL